MTRSLKDGVGQSDAEHVAWCMVERLSLSEELAAYRAGILLVGERQIGTEGLSQATITHIIYLQKAIFDLGQVIDAFSTPTDDQPPV